MPMIKLFELKTCASRRLMPNVSELNGAVVRVGGVVPLKVAQGPHADHGFGFRFAGDAGSIFIQRGDGHRQSAVGLGCD
jgi:hypothetical protein